MAQINKPNEYFNTVLYTGNGGTNNITGVEFQPDFTWIKSRTQVGANHRLIDSVRGATKLLYSNATNAEDTDIDSLTSFNSDGFTLGSAGGVNANTESYASWNWLAGGTGVSNTQGSIASTVSVNTTSGFSVVSYTGNGTAGATIGHGLGATPAMFIIKNRSSAGEHWVVYHQSISPSNMLYFNLTNAQDPANQFNSTAPTANVFSVGGNIMVNATSNNYVAYCFAEKKGFSKFGSYAGNNNADGTFVYTGFSPSFLLVKRYGGGTQNWVIYDNKRNTYNLTNSVLRPNTSDAETTNNGVDLLSNGFKFRSSDGDSNGYSDGYIYMAFAETPLVGTNNIPTTAR